MPANINDKITEVGQTGTLIGLTAPKALSASSIDVDPPTNWPTATAVFFAMRRVDDDGNLVPNTYTEWKGVISSNSITQLLLLSGSDQEYPADSTTQVYIGIIPAWANAIVEALLVSLNQNGTLKAGAISNSNMFGAGVVNTAALGPQAVTPPKWTNPYKFNAYRNAAQNPANGVIQYDAKNFDTNNNFDVTTNKGRYTAPVDGFYQFNVASDQLVTAAPNDPQAYLRKNGTTVLAYSHFVSMYNGTSSAMVGLSVLVSLAAGDYVEVLGGTLSLNVSNAGRNVFSGYLVSET